MTSAVEQSDQPVVVETTDDKAPRGPLGGFGAAMAGLAIVVVGLIAVQVADGNAVAVVNDMIREAISPKTAGVAIAVIGLNVHFGFTGLLNFGQSGFMLLGAYGFAITIKKVGYDVWYALPLGVIVGLVMAGVFCLIMGAPTLKLRGDYLAIVTISAAEIIRYTGGLSKLDWLTGATEGIPGKYFQGAVRKMSFFSDSAERWDPLAALAGKIGLGDTYTSSGLDLGAQPTIGDSWWMRLVAWSIVLLMTLMVFMLVRSPWGRLLRGIREDEDAIRSLGKNVFAIKMQSLVLGGLLGAVGGMVYVFTGSVQPDSMARSLTFFCWTALLLGGAATIFGPVVGTIVFYALRQFVQGTAGTVVPGMGAQAAEQFSWVVIGVALMLLVIFRPQGMLGDKRELRFNV